MAPERVYQAARRLRVSSQRLLVYLEAHHAPHATASSNLTAHGAALLAGATTSQVLLDSARHYRPKPMRREVYWSWQQMDPEDVFVSSPAGPGVTGRVPVSVATRWLVAGA